MQFTNLRQRRAAAEAAPDKTPEQRYRAELRSLFRRLHHSNLREWMQVYRVRAVHLRTLIDNVDPATATILVALQIKQVTA